MNAMLASFMPTLGWALIDFVWQGALVGLAATIALMLLRNARPQVRYAVGCAALALCLALPLAGIWSGIHAGASTETSPAARLLQFTSRSAPHTTAAVAITSWPITSWRSSLQVQLPWIVALWSIGAGLLAVRMALGMMWVARAGRMHAQNHPRWQRRLDQLAEKLGVECKVGLRIVAELATPVAAGCWKPVVMVPAALIAHMPLDLLEALLAHELAHIRRHDYLVNLIQSAIEALLFYHPVVWWLSRRIRSEREQIADDLAAKALGEPRRLALALHELDRFQEDLRRRNVSSGFVTTSLIPAANGGHLMSRIQRLIKPNQHALSWNIALPIIGLSALCMAVYAHDSAAAATTTSALVASPAIAAAPATPAVAATPAAAVSPGVPTARATTAVATHHTPKIIATGADQRSEAYAMIRADSDQITMSADSRDLPAIERARQHVHGDFIWVRRDGTTWIVQDPAVVAAVESTWAATHALGKQMDALGKQMEVPGKQMDALGKQMDELGRRKSPAEAEMQRNSTQMDALSGQQEALGAQMEAIGNKLGQARDDASRESLEQQLKALETKMKPLQQQMDTLSASMDEQGKQMESEQKPIENLGRQMEQAGKPMEELGKQMDVLGKQEEALAHAAEQKAKVLLDAAIRDGKAVRTDGVHLD